MASHGEDRERDPQVRREPHRVDLRVVDQPGLHHDPAHRALQAAEHEDRPEPERGRAVQLLRQLEKEQGQKKNEADHPGEQAVDVLPPEDALEALEGHAGVDQAELGRFPVLGEQPLPLDFRQRRQHADQRLPLDDRQPRAREARDAAHHHDGEHQPGAKEQPAGDLTAVAFGHGAQGCPRGPQ
jgi:hypothetical protein